MGVFNYFRMQDDEGRRACGRDVELVTLDQVRDELDRKDEILRKGALTEDDFLEGIWWKQLKSTNDNFDQEPIDRIGFFDEGDAGLSPIEQRRSRELQRTKTMYLEAYDLKCDGDLRGAETRFEQIFNEENFYSQEYVWRWCKLLLLAKNFKDAYRMLEHYHAIRSAWLRVAAEMGEAEFLLHNDSYGVNNFARSCNIPAWLRALTNSNLDTKECVEERLKLYGGSPYWDAYELTENEYEEFRSYFDPLKEEDAEKLLFAEYLEGAKYNLEDYQFKAGVCYLSGIGVEANFAEAVRWLEAAERNGSSRAALILGEECEFGEFGPIDYDSALRHYFAALPGARNEAEEDIEGLLAEHWKEVSVGVLKAGADLGNNEAAYYLAHRIYDEDPEAALDIFAKLAENGFGRAYVTLALVERNKGEEEEAFRLCAKALDLGERLYAPYQMAVMLEDSDMSQAKKYYQIARDAGNSRALTRLEQLSGDSTI